MKKISIISPCFNEVDNIMIFYQKIQKIFKNHLNHYDLELIIVDDCSNDGSIEILKNLAINDEKLKVVINNTNYGVFISTLYKICSVSTGLSDSFLQRAGYQFAHCLDDRICLLLIEDQWR